MRKELALKLLSKLPSHIRITPYVSYELVYIPEFANKKILGETRPDTKQIVIKSNEPPGQTVSTIIHEILHAIALENDFELTEKQVLALEDGIVRALRLNKIFDVLGKV